MFKRRKTFKQRKEEYEKRLYPICKNLFARRSKGFEGTTKLEVTQATRTGEDGAISDKTIDNYFGGRAGLLTLVFRKGWAEINDSVNEALKGVDGTFNKLEKMISCLLQIFKQDSELKTIFLLEGRRTGEKGEHVTMTDELQEFITLIDCIFKEGQKKGQIGNHINLQAFRSAFFGAIEGMLRDKVYAERINFPGNYSDEDIIEVGKLLLKAATLH